MKSKRILMIVNVVVLLALAGSTGYLFFRNGDLNKELSLSVDERTAKQNQALVDKVSKLIDLPKEEPTIILVNDSDKAKEQNPGLSQIFEDLQKDDYILVYRKARQAINYRPSTNKIVKSSTITLPVSVELVGSQADIDAVATKLADFGTQISIIKTVKDGVTQSFIYDVENDQTDQTASIAKQIGYEVGTTLPSSISPTAQTEIVISVSSSTKSPTSVQP